MHGEPKSKSEVLKLTSGTLTEADARALLERRRWPNGVACLYCGALEPYRIEVKASVRKNGRMVNARQLFACRECKRQFSVTKGTIFEDSKIPLRTWIMVIYRIVASKKGVSAHQIHREFGVSYESAWFMCHRIRYAMQRDKDQLLSGTIEADETYVGGKTRRGHPVAFHERMKIELEAKGLTAHQHIKGKRHPRMEKAVVFGILERGGKVRTMHVSETSGKTLRPILTDNIDLANSRLMTDGHAAYRGIKKHLLHDVIDHELEYVRGNVHTNGIENYWSLLKRGIVGTFHHVGRDHLPCYLDEFEFRFNRRKVSDADRFYDLLGNVEGRLAWYLQPS